MHTTELYLFVIKLFYLYLYLRTCFFLFIRTIQKCLHKNKIQYTRIENEINCLLVNVDDLRWKFY